MKILVDDLREIEADIVLRTYAEAIEYVADNALDGDVLLLDHDLGEEKSGYDVITFCLENGNLPERVTLVTANPVGRDRIASALKNAGYTSGLSGFTYFRD